LNKIISKKNIEKSNTTNNSNKEKTHYRLSNEVVIGSDGIITNNINNGNKNKESQQDELSLFRKLSLSKLADENKRIGDVDIKNSLIAKRNIYNVILIDKFIKTLRTLEETRILIEEFPQNQEQYSYFINNCK